MRKEYVKGKFLLPLDSNLIEALIEEPINTEGVQTPIETLAASKPVVSPNEKEASNKEEPIIEEEQAPTEALSDDEQVVSKWGKKS